MVRAGKLDVRDNQLLLDPIVLGAVGVERAETFRRDLHRVEEIRVDEEDSTGNGLFVLAAVIGLRLARRNERIRDGEKTHEGRLLHLTAEDGEVVVLAGAHVLESFRQGGVGGLAGRGVPESVADDTGEHFVVSDDAHVVQLVVDERHLGRGSLPLVVGHRAGSLRQFVLEQQLPVSLLDLVPSQVLAIHGAVPTLSAAEHADQRGLALPAPRDKADDNGDHDDPPEGRRMLANCANHSVCLSSETYRPG